MDENRYEVDFNSSIIFTLDKGPEPQLLQAHHRVEQPILFSF